MNEYKQFLPEGILSMPNRTELENKNEFFNEFKEYIDELMADAWYSRTERKAFRMLIHQLGGTVKLNLTNYTDDNHIASPNTPECLHISLDGIVAVTNKPLDQTNPPISTTLLSLAPEMLNELQKIYSFITENNINEEYKISLQNELENFGINSRHIHNLISQTVELNTKL